MNALNAEAGSLARAIAAVRLGRPARAHRAGDDADDRRPALLAEQETLARALQSLGAKLQRRRGVDLVAELDTVLTALASMRMWLDADKVKLAVEEVSRERVEAWEAELKADEDYMALLRETVHRELSLSLRDRNRWPSPVG